MKLPMAFKTNPPMKAILPINSFINPTTINRTNTVMKRPANKAIIPNDKELSENTEILGAGNKTDFKSSVLISTWQSMIQYKDELNKSIKYDVIINDEVHKGPSAIYNGAYHAWINTKGYSVEDCINMIDAICCDYMS